MKQAVWIASIVAVAATISFAQLDRSSRRSPELSPLVPGPFRSFSQFTLTASTVRVAEPGTALATAQELVERRPIPAEHLSLLAIAEERAGQREKSALLIQAAARRGWRDPLSQQAMFEIALAAGDPAEASKRLMAIVLLQPGDESVQTLLARFLAIPAGRAAFAEHLAAGGKLLRAFNTSNAKVDRAALADVNARAAQIAASPK